MICDADDVLVIRFLPPQTSQRSLVVLSIVMLQQVVLYSVRIS